MAAARNFICYHYPCPDGIAACLATFIGLTKDVPVTTNIAAAAAACNIVFCPMEIYKPESTRISFALEAFAPTDTVYIVDFSGGVNFIRTACSQAARVVLLDHHKTAEEDLTTLCDPPRNLDLHFDMLRSGAGIARDYFKVTTDSVYFEKFGSPIVAKLNRFFALIEDRDLWRNALPDSQDFTTGLASLQWELNVNANPEVLSKLIDIDIDATIKIGKNAREEQDKIIASETAAPLTLEIPGADARVARGLGTETVHSDLRSSLGNVLASLAQLKGLDPLGIVAYIEERMGPSSEQLIKVSLRSTGDFDTTAISKYYAGGGHKNASSFVVTRKLFESWIVTSS